MWSENGIELWLRPNGLEPCERSVGSWESEMGSVCYQLRYQLDLENPLEQWLWW